MSNRCALVLCRATLQDSVRWLNR